MYKIEVHYRESFSGECGHTGTEIYDGEVEYKDGGMWVYTIKNGRKVNIFYPLISIIRMKVEEE